MLPHRARIPTPWMFIRERFCSPFLVTLLFVSILVIQQYRFNGTATFKYVRLQSQSDAAAASDDFTVTFEGASNFLTLLREEYRRKMSKPRPHCQHNSSSITEIRQFNRAYQLDWIGRTISSVEMSDPTLSSCHFAALQFPPTSATIEKAIRQTTYHSSFYTAGQCRKAFNWKWLDDMNLIDTCYGNNWGGTLGSTSKEKCFEESIWGHPIMRWLDKNWDNHQDGPLKCLELMLDHDDELKAVFSVDMSRSTAGNFSRDSFFEMLLDGVFDIDGFGTIEDWNSLIFQHYVAGGDVMKYKTYVDSTKFRNILKNNTVAACIDELIPYPSGDNSEASDVKKYWKKYGVRLEASSMEHSASGLLKIFPASLRGVLPPPPTAVYAVNAILAMGAHVPSEVYFPCCTPYWNAVSSSKNYILLKKELQSLNLTDNATPEIREEILQICSSNHTQCPFPTYDLVVDVTQVYCNAFFHFYIEIWGRIAPFLDLLLADDMPDFIIRLGCEELAGFQESFYYDLMGLDSSRVKIIGDAPVFAKEVIIPTEGHSHSPLFNYWNLLPTRNHIFKRFNPSLDNTTQKIVLVLIRDASRRSDTHVYNEEFLRTLDEGLPHYNITAFRSSDKGLMDCLKCQIKTYMSADVIIGSHGAGLSHILFAKKRGAVVLERISDSGNSGIYAELPYMMGLKYFPMEDEAGAEAYRDIILFAEKFK